MIRQMILELPVKEALGWQDFYVSDSNATAVAVLEDWENWPQGKLVLVGPEGAGKTHLAHIWAAQAETSVLPAAELASADLPEIASCQRIAVEDADLIAGMAEAEVALFHLHNMVLATGGRLLITARKPPVQWGLSLPDLVSRLQAAGLTTLYAPDDMLLAAVVMKLFADRQLTVAPAVLPYMLRRMDRSFSAARALVEAIDRRALAENRAITRPLAAQVLDSLE